LAFYFHKLRHVPLLVILSEVKILHRSRDKLFRKGSAVAVTCGHNSRHVGMIYGCLSLAIIYVNELLFLGKRH
jgi:hypothetical protein